MPIRINRLTPHIGAEIEGIDLTERPTQAEIAEIYAAWLENVVIVFRGQKLAQADLIRVTEYFGTRAEKLASEGVPHLGPA